MSGPAEPNKGLWSRLARVRVQTVVQAASFATLLSLALMIWSVLDPTPMPVMVAMSVGQGIGTLALLAYAGAVLLYQLQLRRDRSKGQPDG